MSCGKWFHVEPRFGAVCSEGHQCPECDEIDPWWNGGLWKLVAPHWAEPILPPLVLTEEEVEVEP